MKPLALILLTLCSCMATNVEEIYVPLGLITQPNKLGQYPAGALSQASGVAMRSPGLATRMPLMSSYVASPYLQAVPVVPHLLGAADSMLFQLGRNASNGHWELGFFSGPATKWGNDLFAAGLAFQPLTFDTTGKTAWAQQRGRYLFNSDQGVLITDTGTPTSNATALPRHAGLQAPVLALNPYTTGNPGAIDANHVTAAVAIVRRVSSDGYEIVSPPSAPEQSGSTTLASDIQAFTNWQANSGYVAGDVIEWYRTPQQNVDVAVGATYYLCGKYTLVPADIAASQIVTPPILTTKDSGLGAELYTNPGETGFNSFKQAPPLAACMATFKGYTFYGNRQDIATLPLQMPFGISLNLPTTDLNSRGNAIGFRSFTATFTNTSNVLTVISATDIVGLAVGQLIGDAALTGGQGTITAVGATTVTLSTTANSNVTKVTGAGDVLVINGTTIQASYWNQFVSNMVLTSGVNVSAAGIDPPVVLTGAILQDSYCARSFVLTAQRAGVASFTIKATNPQNYIPILPATTSTALTVSRKTVPNGLAWSEQGQPEAVPPLNTLPVGSGTIYGMWATRDSLWLFASDGLWQLTGTGGAAGRGFDWSIINRDSTLSLSAPHAACVLRDSVYAYTNRGVVAISSSGIRENISQGRINDLLPGPPFSATRDIQMWADETNDEIWLAVNATTSPVMYVYNTLNDAWTTHPGDSTSTPLQGTYARFLQSVVTIDQNNAYTPDVAQFAALVADLQPVSDGAPMAMKAWIDETWVFDVASTGTLVTPRWNGVDYAAAQRAAVSQSQDARISWSIPRNAPATANTLSPGIRVAQSSSQLNLYGVGLRAVPFSNQRKQR